MRNWWGRTVAIFLFFLVLFSLAGGKKKESSVKAASLAAYAGNCMGGWDNPNNASGPPSVSNPNDSSAFNEGNSAVLNQKAAQIFCGSFNSDNKSQPPSKVSLKLSWNFIFPSQSNGISSSTDADSAIWNEVIQNSFSSSTPSSTSSSTPADASQNPTSTDSDTSQSSSTESNQMPTVTPLTPEVSSTIPITPTSTNGIQSTTQTEQPVDSTSTTSFFNFLIKKVFAQSTDSNQQNFLQITYSIDGKGWSSLGYINESNWKDFSANIPVSSWDDVNKLQIQIAPVTAIDMPAIYLDSAWLEISYDQSIIDSLKQGTNAVLNAASNVGDVINDAINTATDNIKQVVQNTLNPQVAPQNPQPEIKPPKFSFAIKRSLSTETKDLPWFPTENKKHKKQGNISGSANVTTPITDQNSFKVEGTCGDVFYTVLLFRNNDDYLNDPSSAVLNRAYPCTSGNFSQIFSAQDFPNIPDGTYYLLTADQGAQGPWKPNAPIREITVVKQIQ